MYGIIVVGLAGSGKTLLTKTLSEWLRMKNVDVVTVNLDPGVEELPYMPDFDIRESISVVDIMDTEGLGPNGAMIAAADRIADEIEDIKAQIEATGATVAVIDTPGQMEIFAFRESGKFIANNIVSGEKVTLYLFDGVFCKNPLNFVSACLLGSAVHMRLLLPQVNVLTKTDLLKEEEIQRIMEWEDPAVLMDAIDREATGTEREMCMDIARVVGESLIPELIPVSSVTMDGFLDLHTELTRILRAGEELGEEPSL